MKRGLQVWMMVGLGVGLLAMAWFFASQTKDFSSLTREQPFLELPLRLPEPQELGTVLPPEAFAPAPTAQVEEPVPPPEGVESQPPASVEALSPEELKRMEQEGIFSY